MFSEESEEEIIEKFSNLINTKSPKEVLQILVEEFDSSLTRINGMADLCLNHGFKSEHMDNIKSQVQSIIRLIGIIEIYLADH